MMTPASALDRVAMEGATPASPATGGNHRLAEGPLAFVRAAQVSEAIGRTGRRRLVDPTACDRDYAAAEEEFMQAINDYKRRSGRMFPTWSEVLEVLTGLGYEKVAAAGPIPQPATPGARS